MVIAKKCKNQKILWTINYTSITNQYNSGEEEERYKTYLG